MPESFLICEGIVDEPNYPQNYEAQPARGEAVTDSERYLKSLCHRTFLEFWSYPALFTDRKKKPGGHGKELCDLLVVFKNHVIIFSDKLCRFPDTGDLVRDWSRWFRKTVFESAKQIRGAESWIRKFPDRIFLDRACTQKVPFTLPPADLLRFHRVVVAHDGSRRCKDVLGGSGSFMLRPDIVGEAHMAGHEHQASSHEVAPFAIGDVDPPHGYVHVLDDTSLDILMRHLDTITDFVGYLAAKEDFVASGRLAMAAGEEELLALYLSDVDSYGKHAFILPDGVAKVGLDEGNWNRFSTSPGYRAKLEADRISYAWDNIINRFCHHFMTGTSQFCSKPTFEAQEKLFSLFAAESRFSRRSLSLVLMEAYEKGAGSDRFVRLIPPNSPDRPFYIFLTLKPSIAAGRSHEDYRHFRRWVLEAMCQVVRLQYPQATDIVGLAFEPFDKPDSPSSEDAVYFDGRVWSQEQEAEAKELQSKYGFLTNTTMSFQLHHDYPTEAPSSHRRSGPVRDAQMAKSRRNSPCPCGSGRKFKRCCMH